MTGSARTGGPKEEVVPPPNVVDPYVTPELNFRCRRIVSKESDPLCEAGSRAMGRLELEPRTLGLKAPDRDVGLCALVSLRPS